MLIWPHTVAGILSYQELLLCVLVRARNGKTTRLLYESTIKGYYEGLPEGCRQTPGYPRPASDPSHPAAEPPGSPQSGCPEQL